ncbi:hypothetical protein [Salinibaculum rarum]|uniref:hypothetical protein n=1 Tax=Salinibaculum rarum TaxID=3058903 RepID=UPI00265D7F33|nr:hypothetical protein [Salinibaculum sp. KK48]
MATNQHSALPDDVTLGDEGLTALTHDQLENMFQAYGIQNGMRLIPLTNKELATRGFDEFTPTPAFAQGLRQSFESAFIQKANAALIPEAIEIANREATGWTIHNFIDADYTALRKVVLPKFYKHVVYSFAFAAANGADVQAAIYYNTDDDDGRGPLIDG